MRRRLVHTVGAVLCFLGPAIHAHNLPLSRVDLRAGPHGLTATIEAPAIDLAHDLPDVTPDLLLTPAGAAAQKNKLVAILATRLILEADAETLVAAPLEITPLIEQRDVRLRLHFDWSQPPSRLRIRCLLFPYDPRHKTFLDIYREDKLERQFIFDNNSTQIDYVATAQQGTLAVARQFLFEGIHHIFIGPDHILFVVGLLLLGGTLQQLLKIVTAFTVAHSATLVLATLNILTPPARVIEPAIAVSIIFVGAHSLWGAKGKRDLRLFLAFGFGFIHGFGFANVLREMHLPPGALGWSLFSFNAGVELGQACIVLAIAPLLTMLYRRNQAFAGRVVAGSSLAVVFAGSFWFVERLFP